MHHFLTYRLLCRRPAPFGWVLTALLGAWLLGLARPSRAQLGRATPADTARISALVQQGQAVESQQPTAAVRCYQRAFTLADSLGYPVGYFTATRHLVFALNNLGRYPEAKALALRALARARQDTSKNHLGQSHFALGLTAWKQGEFKEAVRQYHQAEHYMRQLHKTYNLGVIHNNLALIYQQQELYDQALKELQLALQFQRQTNATPRDLAITYFNIASNYWRQRNGPQAKHYYRLTRQHLDPRKDLDILVNLYNNLGQMFLHQAADASAERRRILHDSSFYYHRQALQLSRQLRSPVDELHQLNALATIYNDQREYAQARPLLQRALAMVRQHGNAPTERIAIYRGFINMYEGQRNFEAAYRWRDRYEAVADSLDNQATKDLLESYRLKAQQASTQLKLQAKQNQINGLQDERRRQRLWLVLAAVTATAAAGLLALGYSYYQQKQRANAQALLAVQRQQDLLAVQAELHGQQKERGRIAKEMHDDLGGSLTVIGLLSEVLKTRPGTAAAPEVHKISALSAEMVTNLNQIIWSLNARNDSLNGLIAYIRAYAREFLDNTTLALRVHAAEAAEDVSISGDDRRNLFLTIKEALHNVVKHAQATRVTLRLEARAGTLLIEVCDDGRGLAPGASPADQRNGLTNMANRMRESGGQCTVEPAPGGGTCVRLTYPYRPTVAAASPKILQL
ncbi:tetratricopeptide repeat-containing sensor histidine kinase [Hymenobacter weizhouensis]|uniref:tetratricopeptide repeat-containing sensor histidine kinase n=1 Tax=Hymenobacter sp. YIM 151500-1 TaxID=2987689 RepID=UPI0022280900|nr:tetratricopeptide repeat-containing sensor histidine kinase [Hymenobacter sp. YIM 151500-1]UYZ63495.1 tetratricopeptide repeat protein [Hymenobacter sp. YIM 151500-1]